MIMMSRARWPIKVADERQTPKVSPEAKVGLDYKVTIQSPDWRAALSSLRTPGEGGMITPGPALSNAAALSRVDENPGHVTT